MNVGSNLTRRGAHIEITRLEAHLGTLVRTALGPPSALSVPRRFTLAGSLRGLFTSPPTLATGLSSMADVELSVFDQGQTGSCNAHRTAMGLAMALAFEGTPLDFVPSPDALYRAVRLLERAPNANGSFPPLTDTGSATVDMIAALSTIGIEPIRATPLTTAGEGWTDVDAATINAEPKLDALAREAMCLSSGEYAIDLTDTGAALAQVQASLRAGYPVWIDAMVDSLFEVWGEEWTPSTVPLDDVAPANDPERGGHAILITELDVSTAGAVTISGLNSWGAWGAPALATACRNPTGHFRVGPNWFANAVYSATIGKAARS